MGQALFLHIRQAQRLQALESDGVRETSIIATGSHIGGVAEAGEAPCCN